MACRSRYGRHTTKGGRGPRVAFSRVSEREVTVGLQYACRPRARIGGRGGSPCGDRDVNSIEGSPVYTAPMRERGIEPRSLPWRGSGLPLTDSRILFESDEPTGFMRQRGDAQTRVTPRSRVAGRQTSGGSNLANAIPLRYTRSCWDGWEESNLRSFARSISRLQYAHAASPNRTGSCGLEDRRAALTPMPRCCRPDSNRDRLAEDEACIPLHHSSDAVSRSRTGARRSKDVDA